LAAFTSGSAQIARKATDKPASKPTARARERHRVRIPVADKTPITTESDRFLDLGDSFRQDGKWNAAEAAYKEAINVWSGNADALLELGFLYIDRNRLSEAQALYSKLRGVNSAVAAELLADINRYKQANR
jgi:thioredoxin-like negative regulator of GroEL